MALLLDERHAARVRPPDWCSLSRRTGSRKCERLRGGSQGIIATPADFDGTPVGPQGLSPELGQHTEEALLELGYEWEQIIPLKERGAIP
jgi:crotonobetainyl-CoA:carnitine CoA-transferase CaiB-like acyl-CoA transferase